ncbi:PEP-CTERM sorting domain-containing protein [Verrucomicrobiaceae bacterium N1E253]|uniref:PEP-CTERM sorting domain-containing protein n=1 Tax=Oceaniferula marina TaxID=2748318 RepID=A0A851GHD2_9BACT|nr:PEP-CTERM sorting domain-containing protein [Oceaniferula marina]NWK54537.1 PEP-CTERM sorting domain-containing protein [Oceaniferula marina]
MMTSHTQQQSICVTDIRDYPKHPPCFYLFLHPKHHNMKTIINTITGLSIALTASTHAASLIIGGSAPTEDVVFSQTSHNNNSGSSVTTSTGQTFATTTAFDLSAISVLKGSTQNGYVVGDQVRLQIFTVTDGATVATNWKTGSGTSDPVASAGITPIFDSAFDITTSGTANIAEGTLLTFDIGNLSLSANTDYGFVFTFIDAAGGPNNMNFKQNTLSNDFANGMKISSSATNNTTSVNQDLAFYVVSAVPEPSSTTLLGLGGLALILRRRK